MLRRALPLFLTALFIVPAFAQTRAPRGTPIVSPTFQRPGAAAQTQQLAASGGQTARGQARAFADIQGISMA